MTELTQNAPQGASHSANAFGTFERIVAQAEGGVQA
jgi:hypothetical protein